MPAAGGQAGPSGREQPNGGADSRKAGWEKQRTFDPSDADEEEPDDDDGRIEVPYTLAAAPLQAEDGDEDGS
jgi:hypothetical protein